VRLIGIKHVALGSDFDGAVTTPFDVTGLPTLTTSLVEAGFSPSDIEAIMGGNLLRLLTNALPLER
jgi:microsomal dipeptidase-like Zn-dependent dipeptidase